MLKVALVAAFAMHSLPAAAVVVAPASGAERLVIHKSGAGHDGTAMTPALADGHRTVASYSVSPALPAGVSLSTTSGAISGTPTATASQARTRSRPRMRPAVQRLHGC